MSIGSKDGAFDADAKVAAGVDIDLNQHPLNCTTDGTLEVDLTGSSGGPIDVIVDNVVPVSQSGTWTVNLATEPTIDIGKVDQGTPNTLANGWPVKITDGLDVLGTVANPLVVDGTFTPPALQNVNLTQVNGTSINLGQQVMAASIPVVLSSDESALPVTGTFFQTTQPISGTVTANAGTGIFLVDGSAHIQPISGSITVLNSSIPVTQSGAWTVGVNNFPASQVVTLASTTITGVVAVTQSTSPWVVSGTITTSPNVNVHDGSGNTIASTGTSLNVDVTNTVPVTLTSTTITGNVTVVQPTGSNLNVAVSNFPATQAVTGTVAVTQSTSPWVVSSTSVSQASTTSGQLGNLVMGAVLTANPAYTTGQTDPLSLRTTGELRTTGGGVAQASTTSGELGPLVQGAVTTNASAHTNGTTIPLQMDINGRLRVLTCDDAGETDSGLHNELNIGWLINSGGDHAPVWTVNSFSGGTFAGTADAVRQGVTVGRNPTVFKTVQATASGNTVVWTASTGNKWRLLGYRIELTSNASLASGAVLTIKFQDVTTDIAITHDVFVPTTAVTTVAGDAYDTGNTLLGTFGILAAAVTTSLNINLSASLATGNVRVMAYGTEE